MKISLKCSVEKEGNSWFIYKTWQWKSIEPMFRIYPAGTYFLNTFFFSLAFHIIYDFVADSGCKTTCTLFTTLRAESLARYYPTWKLLYVRVFAQPKKKKKMEKKKIRRSFHFISLHIVYINAQLYSMCAIPHHLTPSVISDTCSYGSIYNRYLRRIFQN